MVAVESRTEAQTSPSHLPFLERGKSRVAIIGLGHIGPLGLYGGFPDGTKTLEAWDNLKNGVNGIRLIPHELFPDFANYPNIRAKIGGFVNKTDDDLDDLLRKMGVVSDMEFKSRSTKLGSIAARLALFDAGLMQPYTIKRGIRRLTGFRVDPEIAEEMAAIGGTGMGGASDSIVEAQQELERKALTGEKIDPAWVFRALPGAIEEAVTMDNEVFGDSFGVLGECATGGHTTGLGKMIIEHGDATTGILVNAESTYKKAVGVALFDALGALTKGTDPERFPHAFDENNDGFAFGEAGTAVIIMDENLARLKGHRVYAYVSGYAATSDAYHPSFPREDGKYQKKAILRAIEKAGGLPKKGQIYIRGHATGTKPPGSPSADTIEARVIRESIDEILEKEDRNRCFEQVVAGVSSIKPLTGHLLGADGLTGVLYSALTIQDGIMPGNWKTEQLLPEAERIQVVVNDTKEAEVTAAIINSFGFGGKNTCVVLEHPALP